MKKDTLVYNGFFNIVKREINNVTREIIIMDEAVAVGVINSKTKKMLLVKQFRASVCDYTWEIPAGMMDMEGESLAECMARELKEEAELIVNPNDLKFENSYLPNIGTCNHRLSLFSVIIDEDENKIIKDDSDVSEAKWFTAKEIENMINNGEIIDGKTILMFYKKVSKF